MSRECLDCKANQKTCDFCAFIWEDRHDRRKHREDYIRKGYLKGKVDESDGELRVLVQVLKQYGLAVLCVLVGDSQRSPQSCLRLDLFERAEGKSKRIKCRSANNIFGIGWKLEGKIDPFQRYIRKRIASNSGSPEVMSTAKPWLDSCLSIHKVCHSSQEPQFTLPSRTTEVGNGQADPL